MRRAVAWSAAGKVLEAITLAGLVVLVPRALGPADYGAFAVALAVATGMAIATGIGGPALFARVLAPLGDEERRDVAHALVARLAAARAGWLAALVAAAAVGVALAPGAVGAWPLGLVAAAAVLGSAATLLSQLALGLECPTPWSLRYPLENGVIVVGALALHAVAGLDGAIAAVPLGAGAALVLGLAAARPAIGDPRPARDRPAIGDLRGAGARSARRAGRPTAALPEGALRFARMQAAGGALTQVVHRGAVPACALLGAGAAATGHVAIAVGAALAITYAVAQTLLAALPSAARTYEADRAAAEAALRRVAGLTAAVVVPICAVLALAAEPLLAAGLGDDFRGAAGPLRIALAAAAFAPLWALATQVAALRGRPEATLAGAALGVLAFASVAALALPEAGAEGAAAALLTGVAACIAGTLAALRALTASTGGGEAPLRALAAPTDGGEAPLKRPAAGSAASEGASA